MSRVLLTDEVDETSSPGEMSEHESHAQAGEIKDRNSDSDGAGDAEGSSNSSEATSTAGLTVTLAHSQQPQGDTDSTRPSRGFRFHCF